MLDSLDADAIRRWCAAALEAFQYHQGEIDDLNVYPVPDSDTGTNMAVTMEAAWKALQVEGHLTSRAEVARLMARGALLGARGNSGVIMAQLLAGIADVLGDLGDEPPAAGRCLAKALRCAADAGYTAVATPVEGTILTVARAAARAAEDCDSDNLPKVIEAAVLAADAALVRTPEQLSVLARSGVVDAGGQGLCVLLHSLSVIVTGAEVIRGPLRPHDRSEPAEKSSADTSDIEGEFGMAALTYEVQYLLDAEDTHITPLRENLSALGDSLVIVGTGDGAWNVHVHVNDVGAAIEAGVEAGRPYRIRVTQLLREEQHAPTTRSVVIFVEGPQLRELLHAEGALTSLDGVTGQVIALGTPPRPWSGGELRVIPLRSDVQALAALAVHDPSRPFDDDVIAMAEAVGACRHAEVTVATREALTLAGPCQPGNILVLVDGEVNYIGEGDDDSDSDSMVTAAETVLDRMLSAGGELVTLLLGQDAPAGLGQRLETYLAKRWPFVEARVYPGGQPQHLLMGVE